MSAASPPCPEQLRRSLGGHLPALDGIRGLAILLVLAHNFDVLAPRSMTVQALDTFVDMGWVGVQLFFVLSGFLITGILLDTRGAPNAYSSFLARRVLRIFPLYYLGLVAAFVILPLFTGHAIEGANNQLWLWMYVGNWAVTQGVPAFPQFWSLGVEEQFYLFWPLVVLWLSPRRLLQVCVGLTVVALASRVMLRAVGASPEAVYMYTVCRMDALVIGGAAAVLLRNPVSAAWMTRHLKPLRWAVGLAFVGFLITRGFPRVNLMSQTIGYSLLALIFAAIIVAAVLSEAQGRGRLARLLSLAPLRSIGKYSYGMYIFHSPIHQYLGLVLLPQILPESVLRVRHAALYFVCATIVTYLVAVLSYHLLEKHFLWLKRFFVARPTSSPAAAQLTRSAVPERSENAA